MFETVVPETVAPRSRRLLYETLPLSIALHVIAAGAVLVAGVWDVAFPEHSPKMFAAYQLAAAPPPPPPPPPPAVRAQVVPHARAVTVKMPLVAPTVIPDTIPEVIEEEPVTEVPVIPVADPAGQAGGQEGGIEGGEIGGETGGVIGGIVVPPPPVNPNQIEVERDQPLPMESLSQEYPSYPEFAQKRMWESTLVVRYVIGKNGRVKEVIVLTPPTYDIFERETVETIRKWRFRPYRDREGNIKEVAHELTVNFKLVRGKK
ncbi:MAG TPA: TonB family protein [Thermoanaerobaculia bacterium]|jgi:TonB family protein|nr:TonB family protein [Thermoanaerobaculia bacterium]